MVKLTPISLTIQTKYNEPPPTGQHTYLNLFQIGQVYYHLRTFGVEFSCALQSSPQKVPEKRDRAYGAAYDGQKQSTPTASKYSGYTGKPTSSTVKKKRGAVGKLMGVSWWSYGRATVDEIE